MFRRTALAAVGLLLSASAPSAQTPNAAPPPAANDGRSASRRSLDLRDSGRHHRRFKIDVHNHHHGRLDGGHQYSRYYSRQFQFRLRELRSFLEPNKQRHMAVYAK